MAIIISLKVRHKLATKIPPVTEGEIRECSDHIIKTAYEPDEIEEDMYEKEA